ncbi:hypothetical protein [Kineosporia sp. NBRC 101731]|uniref:hypothetical protein n=1 Tax=Kineosporia sp. NBRC 101731 TaxID=3032199 RepID=UPI0024A36939|nr:hypothetical protein [Kineosporia sp. NBRC 101731]GLY33575.1 hypothetical protein Kisp02_69400 [Kineosporia sp. NBRC 101731]
MALGLTDPLTALSFSAMPVDQLTDYHRALVAAQRDVDHWRRLILARIDLAVASVTDLDELRPPPGLHGTICHPPAGLRRLIGIAPTDVHAGEGGMLIRLRGALDELARYERMLEAVTGEAAGILAYRIGAVA